MKHMTLATMFGVAAALAAPAAARHKVATYTGVVATGSDVAGLFGAAGRDLAGLSFVTVYTYDTTRGRRIVTPANDSIDGGTAENGTATEPFTAATLTIDGVTRALNLDFYGIALVQPTVVEHEVIGDYYEDDLTYNYLLTSVPSLDVNVPTTAGSGGGTFRFGHGGASETIDASGTFATQTLTISGSVPEPATWAMLVTGFAAVGSAARRRRVAASG